MHCIAPPLGKFTIPQLKGWLISGVRIGCRRSTSPVHSGLVAGSAGTTLGLMIFIQSPCGSLVSRHASRHRDGCARRTHHLNIVVAIPASVYTTAWALSGLCSSPYLPRFRKKEGWGAFQDAQGRQMPPRPDFAKGGDGAHDENCVILGRRALMPGTTTAILQWREPSLSLVTSRLLDGLVNCIHYH